MSNSKAFNEYVDWVRDAHAMEEQAETMLTKMASRLDDYPVLQKRIVQHIDETQSQKRLVTAVLERLEASPSFIKDTAAKTSAFVQSLGGIFVTDEVVKGNIGGYVFEHFEIASYASLIAAAQAVGDMEGANMFLQIKRQEEEMAEWLAEHAPAVTQAYLKHRPSHPSES